MTFPPIPPDVLLALSKQFPERAPHAFETLEEMRWRGGQVSVVRFLRRMYDEQNKNILSPEDDAQDVPAFS
jgi:hypothetical protein